MSAHPRYQLVLEATRAPSDADGIRALRILLKRLLRSFGFRCLDCRTAPSELEPNPDGEYSYKYPTPASLYASHNTKPPIPAAELESNIGCNP